MNVFLDLLETYSGNMKLPVSLINVDKQVEKTVNGRSVAPLPDFDHHLFLEEALHTAKLIKKPTIINRYDETSQGNQRYVLSTLLTCFNKEHFLLTGPFPAAEERNEAAWDAMALEEGAEERNILEKVAALSALIGSMEKELVRPQVKQQVSTIYQSVLEMNFDAGDEGDLIELCLERIYELRKKGFYGYAYKNEEDRFIIETVLGSEGEQLIGKKFYIGEGFLGKAVVLGKEVFWNTDGDSYRAEFFRKHHLAPRHLFCIPLKRDGAVQSLFFGGNCEEELNQESLAMILLLVKFFSEKNEANALAARTEHMQSILDETIDLIGIFLTSAINKEVLPYKIIEFCHLLNKENFVCLSSLNGRRVTRGEININALTAHGMVWKEMKSNKVENRTNPQIIDSCLHYPILRNGLLEGLLSVQFYDGKELSRTSALIDLVCQLLILNKEEKKELPEQKDTSDWTDALHDSLKETNPDQHRKITEAQELADMLGDKIGLPVEAKTNIRNACQLVCYSKEFFEKHLPSANAVKLIYELYETSLNKKATDELKVLGFICQHHLQPVDLALDEAIWADKQTDFLAIYYQFQAKGKTDKHLSGEEKLQMEKNEEISDLSGVIKELPLTSREKEILHLILEGLNNQEVGGCLKISVHTVKNHVTHIYKKLNVTDRVNAMAKIYRIKYGEE